ncbi:MAG: sigma-70 family RNA polymerase sigma factor [Gammaproteobacteria bacterium]|nr:MAG: sigma-70 family RNA polymerase sigma factor [Gammaproteobacteria bacterium]
MMESDAVLVHRILVMKDERAFAFLMWRHQLMVRTMLSRCCRRDVHNIDDLVQETFLRAYLSLSSFRSEAKFSTWLYRIAFNLVADKFRRKSFEYCDLDSIEDLADDCNHLYLTDLRTDISKAMSNISSAQNRAVRLCLEEGYTHADAAMEMNMPLGTIKSHVARGKANLQELLSHWSDVA